MQISADTGTTSVWRDNWSTYQVSLGRVWITRSSATPIMGLTMGTAMAEGLTKPSCFVSLTVFQTRILPCSRQCSSDTMAMGSPLFL